jgi:hypothetical protein
MSNKYIGDVVSIGIENILYFVYISNKESLESMLGRMFGDLGKVPK